MSDEAGVSATLDRVIADYRAEGAVPGLALSVVDADGLVAHHTAGWADVAAQLPVGDDALFEIGSIGKSAALIVLQVAEEGRLRLEDPVDKRRVWFASRESRRAITIEHLLTRTSRPGFRLVVERMGETR